MSFRNQSRFHHEDQIRNGSDSAVSPFSINLLNAASSSFDHRVNMELKNSTVVVSCIPKSIFRFPFTNTFSLAG